MGKQAKKKARSFSLTDEEFEMVLSQMQHHGFEDRNLYLLALVEADRTVGLEVLLDERKQRVLRPESHVRLAAEGAPGYSAPGGGPKRAKR